MTYTFLNKKTKQIVSFDLKITEYDAFKAAHPELERHIESAPAVRFDGRTFGSPRTDDTFKEVLAKIGSKFPSSPLDNEMNRKSTKTVKTEQVVKKHRERAKKAAQARRK